MTLNHLINELKRVRDDYRINGAGTEPEVLELHQNGTNLTIVIGNSEESKVAIFVLPDKKEEYQQVLSFHV